MDADAKSRVERLRAWIKQNRKDMLGPDGGVSATRLAVASGKSVAYWSDVLRETKKSFAESSAREIEQSLGMPRLHLEGGSSWPFEDVDQERFSKLSAVQRGRVEAAVIEAIEKIEAEAASRKRAANGA